MARADSEEMRAFAARLRRLSDVLDELADKTSGGLNAVGQSWSDGRFEEFSSGLRECVAPIASFTSDGREYSQRLDEKAALLEAVGAHSVDGGASSAGAGGRTLGGGAMPGASVAGGGATLQPGGGQHYPGASPFEVKSQVVGARLPGFGSVLAYQTNGGGVAFLRRGESAFGNVENVRPFGACRDVMLHGSPNTVAVPLSDGTTRSVGAKEFAQFLVAANGGRPLTQPVRLCSCKTGKDRNGFAAQLSRELGVPVVAPVQSIWFDGRGRALHEGPIFGRRATWRVFAPDGRAWECGDRAKGSRKRWRPI